MGLFSGLFGGGNQSQTTTVALPAFQREALEFGVDEGRRLYDEGNLFNVAGLNPYQTQGSELALNFADQFPSIFGNAQNAFSNLADPTQGPTGGALNNLLSGQVDLDAYNPIADQITNRLTNTFQNTIVPGIRRNSIGNTGIPTSRASLQTRAAGNEFQQNLGDTLGSLYGNALQGAQNRQARGVGLGLNSMSNALRLAPSVANLGMLPSQIYGNVGGLLQNQSQRELDAPFQGLSRLQNLARGNFGQTQTTTMPTQSPFGSLLGLGAGLGLGYMGGLEGTDLLGAGTIGLATGRLF